MVASVIWIAITFYQEFLEVDPNQYGFRSTEVESRMKACSGTFQQRYDCKEAIIISKGYDSFKLWSEKVSLILGPPLLLFFLVNRAYRPDRPSKAKGHLVRRPPPVAKRRVK
jgi:hypothetical protein